MPTLSERLSLAALDDYALWREANEAMFRNFCGWHDIDGEVACSENIEIIDLAQRLSRPGLLIEVAMSWTDGALVVLSDIGADGLALAKLVADTSSPIVEHTGIGRTLWNALGSAALKLREM
jgi:hypothetical protein